MTDHPVEQALFLADPSGGLRLLGRSPGFADDWRPEAERLVRGFGARPEGVACPAAVFAQPFGLAHVAVVRAFDRADGLAFRLLVLPRDVYAHCAGDPFTVDQRLSPTDPAGGELPTLAWPDQALGLPNVEEVQRVLREGDSPLLLGSVQALIDGGRLAFRRDTPQPELLRSLWQLLPLTERGGRYPASFAFSAELPFDAAAYPASVELLRRALSEEQVLDYPAGRFELRMQAAAESGDQRELDRLFSRRSSDQMMKFILLVLAGAVVLSVAVKMLGGFGQWAGL